MHSSDELEINFEHEEGALRSLSRSIAIPCLIQGTKMYLALTGRTLSDLKDDFSENFTTLSYLLDLENCTIYLDFGYNREVLTRHLLDSITS